MEYHDDKYYLEITVLSPRQEGVELTCSIPLKRWDETLKDWKRNKPWEDNFLDNASRKLYGNPTDDLCVYFYDVTFAIKCHLLDRSKRWWNKVIRTVDATDDVYPIKCKLPRLSKQSDLRNYEVTAYISKYVLP